MIIIAARLLVLLYVVIATPIALFLAVTYAPALLWVSLCVGVAIVLALEEHERP